MNLIDAPSTTAEPQLIGAALAVREGPKKSEGAKKNKTPKKNSAAQGNNAPAARSSARCTESLTNNAASWASARAYLAPMDMNQYRLRLQLAKHGNFL